MFYLALENEKTRDLIFIYRKLSEQPTNGARVTYRGEPFEVVGFLPIIN